MQNIYGKYAKRICRNMQFTCFQYACKSEIYAINMHMIYAKCICHMYAINMNSIFKLFGSVCQDMHAICLYMLVIYRNILVICSACTCKGYASPHAGRNVNIQSCHLEGWDMLYNIHFMLHTTFVT